MIFEKSAFLADFSYFSTMKNIVLLLFIFCNIKASSQNPNDKNFYKVEFTYLQKSNYEFDKQGVYADSTLFMKDLPQVPFSVADSPKDKTKKVAFIAYSSLSETEITKLRSIIFHTNIEITSTYYPETKKTERQARLCHDVHTKEIMNLLSLKDCESSRSTLVTLEYSKKPYVRVRSAAISKIINFSDVEYLDAQKLIGKYENNDNKDFTLTNVVEFDRRLNRFITPIPLFKNCNYGVKRVNSLLYTTELISVKYH